MATWKNLDTLASYSKLAELKGHVDIADAMAGEKGAERVKKYSTPMAAGLTTTLQSRLMRLFWMHLQSWQTRLNLLRNSRSYTTVQ